MNLPGKLPVHEIPVFEVVGKTGELAELADAVAAAVRTYRGVPGEVYGGLQAPE